jgi:hypothetical protein
VERPADTGVHRLVHQATAGGFDRLRAAVATTGPEDRSLRLPALAAWTSGLVAEVRAHHIEEDEAIFPALGDLVPSAGGLLATLVADHLLLATLVRELTRALDVLADPTQPFVAAKASADLVLEHVGALVVTHVQVETADLLPLIERHMTHDEHPASSDWPGADAPASRLDWTVPWLLDPCPPDLRSELLDTAPSHVRAAWERSAAGYRTLERAAFVPAPPRGGGLAAG